MFYVNNYFENVMRDRYINLKYDIEMLIKLLKEVKTNMIDSVNLKIDNILNG